MHPQNLTAFLWLELDTPLFTVALDPTSLPNSLHYFYRCFSCQKPEALPARQTAAVQ